MDTRVNCDFFNRISNSISSDKPNNKEHFMPLIAHRGLSCNAPENTISAFQQAIDSNLDAIEFDVRWTNDDEPVLMHDLFINRTARYNDGTAKILPLRVSNVNYEELLNFDFGIWKSDEYKDEKIATFDDVIELAKDNDIDLYIEIKKYSGFDEERAEILVNKIKNANLENKVTWISYSDKYLSFIDKLIPNSRLGLLWRKNITNKTIQKLNKLDTEQNTVFLDVKSNKVTKESADKLNRSGFDFEVWAVDDLEEAEKMYDLNCIGLTTNTLTHDDVDF